MMLSSRKSAKPIVRDPPTKFAKHFVIASEANLQNISSLRAKRICKTFRHCERSEAIQLFFSNQRKAGLLRFARNDEMSWIQTGGYRTIGYADFRDDNSLPILFQRLQHHIQTLLRKHPSQQPQPFKHNITTQK